MIKKMISEFLKDKSRNWKSVKEVFPERNTLIVIRIVNDHIIYTENKEEIYPVEELKLAKYLPPSELSDPKEIKNNYLWWKIEPPFPLYDYSPLSNKESLKKGTYVSHWDIAKLEDIEWWKTRFDYIHKYDQLELRVDQNHRETVYRALIRGASYIENDIISNHLEGKAKEDMKLLYETLCDLQSCMDKTGGK